MKKWLSIGLIGVLLLLVLGAVEVQKRRIGQKTEQFRQEFLQHAPVGENGKLAEVSLDGERQALGLWEGQELEQALSKVDLAWKQPTSVDPGDESRSFEITIGSVWNQDWKVELWAGADKGWVNFPDSQEIMTRWELSPESCRALKRRIWASYRTRLEALTVVPPAPL